MGRQILPCLFVGRASQFLPARHMPPAEQKLQKDESLFFAERLWLVFRQFVRIEQVRPQLLVLLLHVGDPASAERRYKVYIRLKPVAPKRYLRALVGQREPLGVAYGEVVYVAVVVLRLRQILNLQRRLYDISAFIVFALQIIYLRKRVFDLSYCA